MSLTEIARTVKHEILASAGWYDESRYVSGYWFTTNFYDNRDGLPIYDDCPMRFEYREAEEYDWRSIVYHPSFGVDYISCVKSDCSEAHSQDTETINTLRDKLAGKNPTQCSRCGREMTPRHYGVQVVAYGCPVCFNR
jgi:hypothetical protein